jgi:hypothetical protein
MTGGGGGEGARALARVIQSRVLSEIPAHGADAFGNNYAAARRAISASRIAENYSEYKNAPSRLATLKPSLLQPRWSTVPEIDRELRSRRVRAISVHRKATACNGRVDARYTCRCSHNRLRRGWRACLPPRLLRTIARASLHKFAWRTAMIAGAPSCTKRAAGSSAGISAFRLACYFLVTVMDYSVDLSRGAAPSTRTEITLPLTAISPTSISPRSAIYGIPL